jgi:NADH-quinone oxidoreductase subunit L
MNAALFTALGLGVLAMPALLLAVLGLAPLLYRPLSEDAMARWTASCVSCGLIAALLVLASMLISGSRHVPVELGDWVAIPREHFHFHLKFVFDRLSVPFTLLTFVLVGTIGAFANRYLHREAGYGRFFLAFALFLLGMVVASLAGTIETLFLGWELVGLSSALLVAFFHERTAPVVNGQRIWSIYRISDAAFLLAAVALHHVTGAGDFSGLMGTGPWPQGQAALTSQQALGVGLLLLIAAAGKSALVPFSGWLPRAMEGPTPSSALFYGALSVHAGVYLLLRSAPLLEISPIASTAVSTVGALTAVHATLVGRTQSDAKNALAYATMTQVGLMLVAIGLHLWTWTVVHMVGHACLRLYQQLRTPSALHDAEEIHAALGAAPRPVASFWPRLLPAALVDRVYFLALNRFFVDELIDGALIGPVIDLSRAADRFERAWVGALSGWIRSPRAHRRAAEVAARREPRAEGGGS